MFDELEKLFSTLETEAADSDRDDTVVRRLALESGADAYLGYNSNSDQRMLLLVLSSESDTAGIILPRTRGLEVAVRTYPHFIPNTNLLTVSLLLPEFKRMFSVMASEILQDMSPVPSNRDRIVVLVNGILKWQRLLEKLAPAGLSSEAQRGLFAEVSFLNDPVLTNLQPTTAVNAWMGPMGTHHDFQFVSCHLEVKSTISKRHETIRIANELQLDDKLLPALYLAHFRLVVSRHSGTTLPEIIEHVRRKLIESPDAASEFDTKLLNAGYHDSQVQLYEQTRYSVSETSFYHIRDGFPRIVGADLVDGVGDVSYSIAVSSCKKYKIDISAVSAQLGE